MYPWELEKFIRERNYYIGGDDLLKAISIKENPQLIDIFYSPKENKYYLRDRENNIYSFMPMLFSEAEQRGLVKKLVK